MKNLNFFLYTGIILFWSGAFVGKIYPQIRPFGIIGGGLSIVIYITIDNRKKQ